MSDKKKKILVVEDQLSLRVLYQKILEKHGHDVRVAENGKIAIELLKNDNEIDLILLDLMMPELSGEEFLSYYKEKMSFYEAPVCIFSAKFENKAIRDCLLQGADDYLIKPLDEDILIDKCNMLLGESSSENFYKAEVEFNGILLTPGGEKKIEIISISEREIEFKTDIELPINSRIQIRSNEINEVISESNYMILKLKHVSNEGSSYKCMASYIGLNQNQYNNLRGYVIKL